MRITQVKSSIGSDQRQLDTLRSLGLRGIRKSVEHEDSPQLRGMVHAVRHLVRAEPDQGRPGHRRPEAVGRTESRDRDAGRDAPAEVTRNG